MAAARQGKEENLLEQQQKLRRVKEKCKRGKFDLVQGETVIQVPDNMKNCITHFPFLIKTSTQCMSLCANTSRERREWIKYIKSRLRSHTSVEELARLYLPQEFVRSNRLAKLQRERCFNKYMEKCGALAKVSSWHSLS